MVDRVERVTRVEEPVADTTTRTSQVREVQEESVGGSRLIARAIWYVVGILLAIMALRFVLAALGANPNNAFADFVYSASHPLVAPFFSLFNYNMQYGVSRIEVFTLVAMAVYYLIGYALAKLATINSTRDHTA